MKYKVAILKINKINQNTNVVTMETVNKLINEYNDGLYNNKYFKDGSLPVFFNEDYMVRFPDEKEDNTKHIIGKTDKFYVEDNTLFVDITPIDSPLTKGFNELLKNGAFLPVGLTAYYKDTDFGTIIENLQDLTVSYPRESCSFEDEFGIKIVDDETYIHIGTIEPKWELIPEEWTEEDLKETVAFLVGAFTKYKDEDKDQFTDMNQDLCDYVRKILKIN